MISLDDRPVGGLETWLLLRDELSVALGFALEFLHGNALDGIGGTNCSGDADEICNDDSCDSMCSGFILMSLIVGMVRELSAKMPYKN